MAMSVAVPFVAARDTFCRVVYPTQFCMRFVLQGKPCEQNWIN
jgi:hypothetical protein